MKLSQYAEAATPWFALSVLILLGFIWGTGYSIARFAMTHGVAPVGYSFWQSVGPAILISLLALICRRQQLNVAPKHLLFYFTCGLFGIFLPNTIMYFAAPHLPAHILAIIVNTVPIIAYPLALLVQLESFHWQRCIGILLGLTGLLLIIIPKGSLPSPDLIPWVLLTLLTPLCFAACSIYIARYRPDHTSTIVMTAGTLIFSSLLLTPFVLLTQQFYPLHFPFNTADQVILLEIALSSVGYLLFFYLLKIAGPVYYSLVDTVVVLTGVFWGYLLFQERLNRFTFPAVILILMALLLVTQQQRRANKERHASSGSG